MSRESGTDYQFVETDSSTIVAALIESYERITGRTVQPASADRLFIAWVSDVMVQLRAQVNYAGNQNIPSRAVDENLDALGELFFNTERPQAKAATVNMRFTISEAQSTSILVPAGTRVTTASGNIVFATTKDAYIAIGDTTVDVEAQCEVEGDAGNGYAAGQLNTLVDIFSYYESCTNTEESAGGADEASDDEYYELMRASEDAYSTAGAKGSYVYWAKSVDVDIADVVAITPIETLTCTLPIYEKHAFKGSSHLVADTLVVYAHGSSTLAVQGTDYIADYADDLLTITLLPGGALYSATQIDIEIESAKAGYVYLYALMADGTKAGSAIKTLILNACNDATVRPLTDTVSVEDPNEVVYNIDITYYIPAVTTQSASAIEDAVDAAVAEYVAWQSGKLGRDINPSKLTSLLMATGIKRVVVTSPTYMALGDGSDDHTPDLAVLGTVNIVNGGYENE